MNQYNQQQQHANRFSGPGVRGGYHNGGRGNGKKSRGGKFNGNGNYNGNYNDHRHPPNGLPNYGPPAVPNMSIMPAMGGYPAGPPSAWQMPRDGYPMPVGGMGNVPGTNPYVAPPVNNPAALMGFGPGSSAVGHVFPGRIPSYGSTAANTTRNVTPSSQVTTPRANPSVPKLVTDTKDLTPALYPGDNGTFKPQAVPNGVPGSSSSDTGNNMRAEAPSFQPTLHAPIPRRNATILSGSIIAASTPVTPKQALRSVAPTSATYVAPPAASKTANEGHAKVSNINHKKLEETVESLGGKALSHFQALDNTTADDLRTILEKALKHSRAKQDAAIRTRKELSKLLLNSNEQMMTHEDNIVYQYNCFIHKMTEALNSDNKEALQREAIASLKEAKKQSELAFKYSVRVELFRKDLNALEIRLIDISNDFAGAVYGVMMKALDRPKETTTSADEVRKTSKVVDDSLDATGSTNLHEANDHTKLPEGPGDLTPQAMLERHPETAHQGTDGVSNTVTTTEEQSKLKEPEKKGSVVDLMSLIQDELDVGATTQKDGEAAMVSQGSDDSLEVKPKDKALGSNAAPEQVTTKDKAREKTPTPNLPAHQAAEKAPEKGSKQRKTWAKKQKNKKKGGQDGKGEGEASKTKKGGGHGGGGLESG